MFYKYPVNEKNKYEQRDKTNDLISCQNKVLMEYINFLVESMPGQCPSVKGSFYRTLQHIYRYIYMSRHGRSSNIT